jgi:hypothetical protein
MVPSSREAEEMAARRGSIEGSAKPVGAFEEETTARQVLVGKAAKPLGVSGEETAKPAGVVIPASSKKRTETRQSTNFQNCGRPEPLLEEQPRGLADRPLEGPESAVALANYVPSTQHTRRKSRDDAVARRESICSRIGVRKPRCSSLLDGRLGLKAGNWDIGAKPMLSARIFIFLFM